MFFLKLIFEFGFVIMESFALSPKIDLSEWAFIFEASCWKFRANFPPPQMIINLYFFLMYFSIVFLKLLRNFLSSLSGNINEPPNDITKVFGIMNCYS